MKLTDFFVQEAVIPELTSTDRNGVIREMMIALAPHIGMTEDDASAVAKQSFSGRTRAAPVSERESPSPM
jgi:hypothetical protein